MVADRVFAFSILKILPFFCAIVLGAEAEPSVRTLTQFEGLESTFYSEVSGKAYFSLKYESAAMKHPKIGFLKFGMSFLEVKKLKAKLNLEFSEPENLFSQWEMLLKRKSIRYATFEPIEIVLIDINGSQFLIQADHGKLSSNGRLVLWGDVSLKNKEGIESFPRISLFLEGSKKNLILEKNENEHDIFLIK